MIPKEVWNGYYKFTLERNPFDKVVSLYYWRGGDKKFGSLYRFISGGGLQYFDSYDIYAANGVVAVDHIYRYEDLAGACADLSKKLSLTQSLEMPAYRAKSLQRKVKDYRDLFDEQSIELVRVIFAREIKLLGYTY
ncbi:MAG: hypothetical protein AAFZ63_04740 [Bacteroidota bacterium]